MTLNVEQLKEVLSLKPVLIKKLAPMLRPFAKAIYYVLSGLLLIGILASFVDLFRAGFSFFILELALIIVALAIVRMFSEYLVSDKAAAETAEKTEQKASK